MLLRRVGFIRFSLINTGETDRNTGYIQLGFFPATIALRHNLLLSPLAKATLL